MFGGDPVTPVLVVLAVLILAGFWLAMLAALSLLIEPRPRYKRKP